MVPPAIGSLGNMTRNMFRGNGLAACQAAGAAYPNILTALGTGGQFMLTDNERLDSYARVLRWLNNRALVRQPGIDGAREALGHGRSYGVFAVLGEPGPVSFRARTAAGDVLTCKGRVTRVYHEDGEPRVDCEVWEENQGGEVCAPGTATVILPSRG